ncbi:MAG: hypothetical protein AAF432_08195 [Planctomycetota bacterium]
MLHPRTFDRSDLNPDERRYRVPWYLAPWLPRGIRLTEFERATLHNPWFYRERSTWFPYLTGVPLLMWIVVCGGVLQAAAPSLTTLFERVYMLVSLFLPFALALYLIVTWTTAYRIRDRLNEYGYVVCTQCGRRLDPEFQCLPETCPHCQRPPRGGLTESSRTTSDGVLMRTPDRRHCVLRMLRRSSGNATRCAHELAGVYVNDDELRFLWSVLPRARRLPTWFRLLVICVMVLAGTGACLGAAATIAARRPDLAHMGPGILIAGFQVGAVFIWSRIARRQNSRLICHLRRTGIIICPECRYDLTILDNRRARCAECGFERCDEIKVTEPDD